ncbi:Xylan alpha-(1-_2)-glucuronosidase [compost metagenome]
MAELWKGLDGLVAEDVHRRVASRLEEQRQHAGEWRDIVNAYFYRKSGIPDEKGRVIY